MQNILVISADTSFISLTERLLSVFFQVFAFSSMDSALEFIYNEIPPLVIVDIDPGDKSTTTRLKILKEDPLFSQMQAIAVFTDDPVPEEWENLVVEDYLRRNEVQRDLLMRVNLALNRSARLVEINPLTRLPGNISINREIQTRLDRGTAFALAYANLSSFKPFNDRYGFSRGDEALKITGRLIYNIVKNKQAEGSFVGHIGGDDFVFILAPEIVENACSSIIQTFDAIIPTLYDPEDRENQGIESIDRQGVKMTFPFIGIYIGVTSTVGRNFSHLGQVVAAASEMRGHAKKQGGSSYSIDQRILASN